MATTAPPPSDLSLQTNGVDLQHAPAPLPSYSSCIPHLIIQSPRASEALVFYKRAFAAEEISLTFQPKRKADQELPLVKHAHLKFGAAEIMLCDEVEECGPNVKSPGSLNGTSGIMHVDTNDADLAFARAVEAGAKPLMEVADQPWGMRYGMILDPFGFAWSFGTALKELNEAEEQAVADGE